MSQKAGVESITTFLRALESRHFVRAIGDPTGIGDILQGTLIRKDNRAL